jgi:hypothetical protein
MNGCGATEVIIGCGATEKYNFRDLPDNNLPITAI